MTSISPSTSSDIPVGSEGRVRDIERLTHSFRDELRQVRDLIEHRAFREETFVELVNCALGDSNPRMEDWPPWLAEMGAGDGKPLPDSTPRKMAEHLLSRGGKMFRASMVLGITRCHREIEGRDCKLAAAIELIHLATLVHDDIIDRAETRRGAPSLPASFGNAPTVLMGDHLYARAFELIAECGMLSLISSTCRATSAMCRGEIEQLAWIGRRDIPEEVYYRLIEMKTAALMASSAECAALLCGKDTTPEWHRFGLMLGLAFQMTDDLLDFTAKEDVLGKKVGGDVAEGKYTLPLILYRDGSPGRNNLEELLEKSPSPSALNQTLEESGTLERVRHAIRKISASCHEILDRLRPQGRSEPFECLHGLVDFTILRDR